MFSSTPTTSQAPLPMATSSHNTYADPFKVSAFTFKKVVNATLSLGVAGIPSALYTGVAAAELPEYLNLHASSMVKVTLGSLAILGNTVCNTQQVYDTVVHMISHRVHPHEDTPASSLKYKTAVIGSALSGAGVVAFIAGVQLQSNYPNYYLLLLPSAAAAGAEFFLGGVPLYNVIFKQLPEIIFGSRPSVTHTNGDAQPLLSNHNQVNGVVVDTLPNQMLETVFAKIAKVLHSLNKEEKNTLMILCSHLYHHADTKFQENPGLLFSTLLFGKIDKAHPIFKQTTNFSREKIVTLLNEPKIALLLKKLRTEIANIELPKGLSGYDRVRLASLMGVITFTCFSYLYDMAANLIKMVSSVPGGVALSLLGFPGFIMMCGLGVNLSRIMMEKWDQTKWSEIPWTKVSASILVGAAGALLEATLCAMMANHINGLNWAFSIVGLVTKGVIINAPYAYRFIDALIYVVEYTKNRIAPSEKPEPTGENVTDEIMKYVELLEHNTAQVSYADLAEWHEATDKLFPESTEAVTIKPTHAPHVIAGLEMQDDAQTPKQSWGNWLLENVRKPYEMCGLVCPRPANRSTYTSIA